MATETKEIIAELANATVNITDEQLDEFMQKINRAKRIFVYGTGRSGLMLKTFAMRLMQMGYISYVVGETITPSIECGDLLIVASASGETDSVCRAAKKAKSQQIDIVTITATPKSTLFSIQEPLIFIKSSTKFNTSSVTVQPLGSLFEQVLLIVFDAIILKISRAKENMNNDMAKRHASIE